MSKKIAPVQEDTDPWETGELGRSEEHARVADDAGEDQALDQAANLQQISIRLEKDLIDTFKLIAAKNKNIGYQTLMRQCLKRFALAELKKITKEMQSQIEASEKGRNDACPRETAAA